MRYKGYVYFIVYIALFALIGIRSGSSAMIYDYASKENLEAALIDNLTTTSNIGVRKGNDGGYWFFEPNTLSAGGSSCCEGDLMTRVYARLDQYGYVIISRETDEDKISYRISPEDPTIIGGLPYAYGWGIPYSPGYPYQWGGFPGGLGTSPTFDGGYLYPWG